MPKDELAHVQISNRELVFKGRIWDVVSETFQYGQESLTREFVQHPGAVAVVALNAQNEVLMIRQYRHPVKSYLWELPAGLLDVSGESTLDAAQRELLEETGYRAGIIEPLIDFFTTPGGNSERISIFVANDLELVGHDLRLEGEEHDMDVAWVPLPEALSSVLNSQIKSPTAQVGIMAISLRLGLGAS